MTAPLPALVSGAMAFLLTSILIPPIRRICARWKLYDSPGPLKIHSIPIPRLGGVAIASGLAISVFVFSLANRAATPSWPFFAALCLIWAAGLTDDLRGLSPAARIAAQIIAALVLWRVGWRLPTLEQSTLGVLALCLFILFFANALNFLDGSDGLAAGVAGVIALTYIALSPGMESAFARAIAWSLLGSCVGFLPFNFPRAKIYMGDSGSTLLGFTIAFLGLDFFRAKSPVPAITTIFFPLLVAALPLLDAALAVLRRLLNRGSMTKGDRRHYYDLLLARGWPPRTVLFVSLGISSAFGVIATVCLRCSPAQATLLAVISLIALFVWIVRLGSLQTAERSSQHVEEVQS